MAHYRIHLRVTVSEIAEAAGLPERLVGRHIAGKRLRADDLVSVVEYVNRARLMGYIDREGGE